MSQKRELEAERKKMCQLLIAQERDTEHKTQKVSKRLTRRG